MPSILTTRALETHIAAFNANDHELYQQHIPNADAAAWLAERIPLLDCPDADIEETYYFRWWTFRKHIKTTPDGFVITEFLPDVHWSGKYNAINCPAGHHFYEGRWLRDNTILRDYAHYWLRHGGDIRSYSSWIAEAIVAYARVTGDQRLGIDLLPDLIANDQAWDDHRGPDGLYWQMDDRDGMEHSISGKRSPDATGYRVTINSYMFGDALAIAQIATLAGDAMLAQRYQTKAAEIKQLTEQMLWDESAGFFKVLPRVENAKLTDVRELHGYTPWYFNMPGPERAVAWSQLMDPQGFYARFGPTTAEQRHPEFAVAHEGAACQWNGPSWPFSTSVTLTALANLLNGEPQNVITRDDYLKTLDCYTRSHSLKLEDGREVKWIDENLDPYTGEWLARAICKTKTDGQADNRKIQESGKDYNHSTYCDLIINGLIGFRPQRDGSILVNPLVPESWDYFCLDGVAGHGRVMTVLYDRTGERYGRGAGLHVFEGDREIASAPTVSRLHIQPQA